MRVVIKTQNRFAFGDAFASSGFRRRPSRPPVKKIVCGVPRGASSAMTPPQRTSRAKRITL
jgi:hypothetical protein